MNVYYQWKMSLVQVSDYTCLFYSFLVSKIKYHFVCTCFLKKKKTKKLCLVCKDISSAGTNLFCSRSRPFETAQRTAGSSGIYWDNCCLLLFVTVLISKLKANTLNYFLREQKSSQSRMFTYPTFHALMQNQTLLVGNVCLVFPHMSTWLADECCDGSL